MKSSSLLQSKKWQKLQQDLGKTTFFEEKEDFSYLATLETTPVGNYLYLPYGPVADTISSFKKALKSLEGLAKENSALFIRVEPRSPKIAEYLRHSAIKTTDLNPKETWKLDLSTDLDTLKHKLPSRLLRYYKNHEKSGLSIETSHDPKDIHYLVELQSRLAAKKNINIFSEKYLATELAQDFATLYLVKYTPEGEKNPKVIAAGLVFDDKTTRYNLQGAQDESYKKLHATGILTIRLILDAHEKGLETFDFWGIAPENAKKNHPWAGFTAFKKTFDGYEDIYCGTYDIALNRPKYALYSLLRKLNRLKRKLK